MKEGFANETPGRSSKGLRKPSGKFDSASGTTLLPLGPVQQST